VVHGSNPTWHCKCRDFLINPRPRTVQTMGLLPHSMGGRLHDADVPALESGLTGGLSITVEDTTRRAEARLSLLHGYKTGAAEAVGGSSSSMC
jgi:hypothetical protein